MSNLGVDAAPCQRKYGFAEQFRQARVWLEELGDFFDSGFPIDRKVTALKLFGDPGANHVHPDYLSRLACAVFLGNYLH